MDIDELKQALHDIGNRIGGIDDQVWRFSSSLSTDLKVLTMEVNRLGDRLWYANCILTLLAVLMIVKLFMDFKRSRRK
ncbi:hypothetical protein DNH61_01590 [Paenibacillus sambharensis]|uniref:Uncharacterized protein n=1 Tax=Paenibacillus sambharensis TaxID=1803190 RepID=A0A2W1M0Y5_9BACL|nr:hypothetical protein DNH61_01590 [Paenibacillus sambharensis]